MVSCRRMNNSHKGIEEKLGKPETTLEDLLDEDSVKSLVSVSGEAVVAL